MEVWLLPELKLAARAAGVLRLQQFVAQPAHVHAELDGVVASAAWSSC